MWLTVLQQQPDMYSSQVRQALRHTSIGIVIAILFIATGVGTLILFRSSRPPRDRALLWFGIFLVLYGLRISDLLRIVVFVTHPLPPVVWQYFAAVITHIIIIPPLFFLGEILPKWRRVLRIVLWAQVPLVLTNLIADAVLHQPDAFAYFNRAVAVILFLGFVIAIFTLSQKTLSTRGLRIGLVILAATIVINNLNGTRFLHIPFNPEPIGLAIFVLTLGSLITSRAVRDRERLIALDRELEIAREIQASILPRTLPNTAHIRVAARYLPMTAVAGDFYDVLVLDELHYGIVIADVSGHGVPAALIASMVKVAIAAQLPNAADPAMVLAGVNQTLCGKLTASQFVTAAYLYLDLEHHLIRFSAAGHPEVFFHQSINGTLVSVEENGLPLGLISVATYSNTERPLVSGTRFLLYTDGLLETRNPAGEFFGPARVQTSLAQTAALEPQAAADTLLATLAAWTASPPGKSAVPQEDDLTLVFVDAF